MKYLDWFGWLGTALVFTAFALNDFGILSAHDLVYQLMNLVGAAGIGLISWKKRAYQPAALNLVWFLIALTALIRVILA